MSDLSFGINFSLGGRYKLARRKAILVNGDYIPGPVIQETGWCKNLITLNGFNAAATTANTRAWSCVVGSGNAAPSEANTTLASFIAGTTSIQSSTSNYNATVSPRYFRQTAVYRFGVGVAAGNISEVGVTSLQTVPISSTPILSRALVVDSGGLPTTVTVLSDEYLDVTWELTIYVPEDVLGSCSMTLDGVATTIDFTCRAGGMTGTIWGSPGGGPWICIYRPYVLNGAGGVVSHVREPQTLIAYDVTFNATTGNTYTSISDDAYVLNSKIRTYTLTLPLNNGNFATGIGLIGILLNTNSSGGSGIFQFSISPKIMKTASKTLTTRVQLGFLNAP